MEPVPFNAFEGALTRLERTIKRLWILCIMLILLLVGSNVAWLVYESQFEYVETTETYEADAKDGGIAVSNGSGDVNIGEK